MPVATESVIGHLVDVQGHLLTATLIEDEQGQSPVVTIAGEDILVGQIGAYVAVRQNDINIIAMVTRMTEQEALLGASIETPSGEEARLPFAKRIARLTPICRRPSVNVEMWTHRESAHGRRETAARGLAACRG